MADTHIINDPIPILKVEFSKIGKTYLNHLIDKFDNFINNELKEKIKNYIN